ncbi:fatty acid synthase subunit alpha reductase [Verticillium alfalfae VaMs.102]|uniref:Fatty acid synthase subunit alpha n=1 Tax=Verticillium alfalfae (strain VaMs.102 / ATCC MYA-4576 / FGSC 10136) TaxID=526221 RepID=C9S8D2_VERA1|nr:fatty acid synthase subunit alpha reductase [Verticillium alfalfae VaMs.102]EEY14911.1 fatty acid synthase subunit alpha reductase [Verticillium alfalfae VaMs.102]
MYYDVIFGRLQAVDREIVSQCIRIMNRANPTLIDFMQYHMDNCPTDRGETYKLSKQLGLQLIENCKDVLNASPVYKDVAVPTGPRTTVDAKGNLKYEEVQRPSCRKLEHYVQQMAEGGKISEYGNRTKVQNDLKRIYKLIREQHKMSKTSQLEIKSLYGDVLRSLSMSESQIIPKENGKPNGVKKVRTNGPGKGKVETIPFLHLKRKTLHGWDYSKKLTASYLTCLEEAARDGVTYAGKYVLMTGAGAGSIGADVLQGLISGGAKVVVTTSRFSREVTEYYQSMYARYGSKGSQLVVVPFNQGSKQDVEELVQYIYDTKTGLGWDLDFIIPFAAIPENGRQIDNIDSKSELAHRIMLTNLLRLLGCVKIQKAERGFETRPAQVVLPMSPNHGTFGNDGLYSESKLALETLFNRWHSEDWGHYLTICGAVIGWTRGTGLMGGNNVVAEGVEAFGVRTFSQQEMAFNLLGLLAPAIVDLCQSEPVFADLNGGLQFIPNLNETMTRLRKDIMETSETRRIVAKENAIENKVVNGPDSELLYKKKLIEPRANMKFDFPPLPDWDAEIAPLNDKLKGMVDLEKVVVVTGFAEVGPWGNSRTRWEMEAYGEFSIEGCVEMAWIMGLIKNHNGPIKGKPYSGWVDAKTGDPIEDKDIKPKFEKHILEHSGIRLIEPELFDGYDPNQKQLLHEVVIEEDLEPFEASKETAEEFKREHGDKVEIFEIPESGEYIVRMKKGAGLRFRRPFKYGVPEDIIDQVDPVTLFVLVSVAEALLSSGITDPYEFYKYVHVSEVGNCIGSGMGGAGALRGMHRDRFLDKPVQNDILQESFINTMAAWVNMLLLSSSGPIKTPVGACATSVESVDIGYETIMEGKAKIVFVGGFDDFGEEGSYEFANMKATSNAVDELAHGRTPKEIDKIGRSVPAPGQGILTTAREHASKFPSPLLDINYRRRQIELRKKQVKQWQESELEYLWEEVEAMKAQGHGFDEKEYAHERALHIEKEAQRQEKEVLRSLGNNFWKSDPTIAPLRGALATWGLTIDDLDVASFHGTSTKANDKNESSVVCQQLKHLGRKKGNAVLGIFQKYLTGHPKGAAGAWMMNGCLQVLNSGLVPGNRNADNVDAVMEQFDMIVYPSRSIQTDGVKAFSVTSFGFGQKGAQAIGVHPKYLYAALDEETYEAYSAKVEARQKKAYRFFHNGMINNTLFVAKSNAPYDEEQLGKVLLNPDARVSVDKKTSSLTYAPNFMKQSEKTVKTSAAKATQDMMETLAKKTVSSNSKVGVDVEDISAINIENETFVTRNFTAGEIAYCQKAPSPQSSFAGRWSAKEAVFKSLGVASKGAGAALKDIEISKNEDGAPVVNLHGDAAAAAKKAGLKEISVSISHSDSQAIAVAVATF